MKTSMTEQVDDWIAVKTESGMPPRLIAWRQKLSEKAKRDKKFRFYSLYGLITHPDTLWWAWTLVQRNDGAPGVDGISFDQILKQEGGAIRFLEELEKELKEKRYKAKPVRRVYIEKDDGKWRPLGIPIIKDRVAQMAVKLIIEPIFEVDFNDCSYGYRPGKSAQDAVRAIQGHLKSGKNQVYDADLSGYFDSIPHDKLMACVEMRVIDGSVLRLIWQWLEAPVIEPKDRGKGSIKNNEQGTPQGGVISPLLANLYLHWFEVVLLRELRKTGEHTSLARYADDFVILSSNLSETTIAFVEEKLEGWMGLKINRVKTRCLNLREQGQRLDFLGYSFRYENDLHGRKRKYLKVFPSPKSLKRERSKIKEMTDNHQCHTPIPILINRINQQLKGWSNYYAYGHPRSAFSDINIYIQMRLKKHLNRRSQRKYITPEGKSFYQHVKDLGLVYL